MPKPRFSPPAPPAPAGITSSAVCRLGFAVKLLTRPDLKSNDTRRWQQSPHLRVSIGYLREIFAHLGKLGLSMYRISSDVAPYVTHPEKPEFHGQIAECARELRELGALAHELKLRLSFHPSQYIILDSPSEDLTVRSMRDIERAVAGRDGRLEGVVRLTTSDAFSGFFVRRLTALHAEHPGLLVEILSANRTFDLTRAEADLAVRMVPTTQPDLICRQVATVGWSLFASESYISRRGPLASAAELGGHELIGYDESLAGTPGARWLAEYARAARIVMRGNSIGAVINAAIVGIGIALVPCYLVAGEPTIRRLVPGLLLEREVWLVFHPDAGRIARVRRVIDFVTEVLEAERRVLRGAAN